MDNRLYIGNLPPSATESDLSTKFGRCGTVVSVAIATDQDSGRSRRFGFVEMANEADVKAAINRLNMTQYDEVTISVSRARPGQSL
jgi:RNA recognition motif-containing protein